MQICVVFFHKPVPQNLKLQTLRIVWSINIVTMGFQFGTYYFQSSTILYESFVHFISRIKKLIDMDAMILSRLTLVVLDMHRDAKGYTLLTLKQIR